MSKTTSTRLALYVTEESDHEYFHVRAHVVTLGTTEYERRRIDEGATGYADIRHDTIRNIGDDLDRGLYLANLRINSQGNQRDEDRRLYAFEVRYQDLYAVDLPMAERMAKTLKTIAARMAKSEATFGHPATFGAYLARVAEAIGAEAIVKKAGASRGSSYRDNAHTIRTIRDGVYEIDYRVRQWADRTEAAAVSA